MKIRYILTKFLCLGLSLSLIGAPVPILASDQSEQISSASESGPPIQSEPVSPAAPSTAPNPGSTPAEISSQTSADAQASDPAAAENTQAAQPAANPEAREPSADPSAQPSPVSEADASGAESAGQPAGNHTAGQVDPAEHTSKPSESSKEEAKSETSTADDSSRPDESDQNNQTEPDPKTTLNQKEKTWTAQTPDLKVQVVAPPQTIDEKAKLIIHRLDASTLDFTVARMYMELADDQLLALFDIHFTSSDDEYIEPQAPVTVTFSIQHPLFREEVDPQSSIILSHLVERNGTWSNVENLAEFPATAGKPVVRRTCEISSFSYFTLVTRAKDGQTAQTAGMQSTDSKGQPEAADSQQTGSKTDQEKSDPSSSEDSSKSDDSDQKDSAKDDAESETSGDGQQNNSGFALDPNASPAGSQLLIIDSQLADILPDGSFSPHPDMTKWYGNAMGATYAPDASQMPVGTRIDYGTPEYTAANNEFTSGWRGTIYGTNGQTKQINLGPYHFGMDRSNTTMGFFSRRAPNGVNTTCFYSPTDSKDRATYFMYPQYMEVEDKEFEVTLNDKLKVRFPAGYKLWHVNCYVVLYLEDPTFMDFVVETDVDGTISDVLTWHLKEGPEYSYLQFQPLREKIYLDPIIEPGMTSAQGIHNSNNVPLYLDVGTYNGKDGQWYTDADCTTAADPMATAASGQTRTFYARYIARSTAASVDTLHIHNNIVQAPDSERSNVFDYTLRLTDTHGFLFRGIIHYTINGVTTAQSTDNKGNMRFHIDAGETADIQIPSGYSYTLDITQPPGWSFSHELASASPVFSNTVSGTMNAPNIYLNVFGYYTAPVPTGIPDSNSPLNWALWLTAVGGIVMTLVRNIRNWRDKWQKI